MPWALVSVPTWVALQLQRLDSGSMAGDPRDDVDAAPCGVDRLGARFSRIRVSTLHGATARGD